MTTLDDLAAAAESADARQWWSEPELEMTVGRDARFIAAADPTTVLRLVAVARAAQDHGVCTCGPDGMRPIGVHYTDCDNDEVLSAALAALEE